MKKLLFTLMVLFGSMELLANPYVLPCEQCSDSQKLSTARSFASDKQSGSYDIYLSDLSGGVLSRVQVMIFSEPGMRNIRARFVMPTSEMQAGFDDALAAQIEMERLFEEYRASQLPDDFPWRTAYDLVGNRQAQLAVRDWLSDNHMFWYYSTNIFSNIMGIFRPILSTQWKWEVNFPDGSKAYFLSGTFGDTDAQYTYIKGESQDSEGNAIAETGSDYIAFQGQFSSTQSLEDWLMHAKKYGISIIDENDNRLKNVKVVCYVDGTKVTCVVAPVQ